MANNLAASRKRLEAAKRKEASLRGKLEDARKVVDSLSAEHVSLLRASETLAAQEKPRFLFDSRRCQSENSAGDRCTRNAGHVGPHRDEYGS